VLFTLTLELLGNQLIHLLLSLMKFLMWHINLLLLLD
jgi:hypothetical protein